jgi:hypothetical protein
MQCSTLTLVAWGWTEIECSSKGKNCMPLKLFFLVLSFVIGLSTKKYVDLPIGISLFKIVAEEVYRVYMFE